MQASQNEVSMNIPEVEDIAKTFEQISDTLKGVSKTLEMLINLLKGTAFIGLVGNAVEAMFLEVQKKHIDQMADKAHEISEDVHNAVEAYKNGDQQGSTKFH